MPNQRQSHDGIPHKDSDRPSPDVQMAHEGQSSARGSGISPDVGGTLKRPVAGEEKGVAPSVEPGSGSHDYRGDGPAKVGITSSDQPDLVAPSGVNEGDHGMASPNPMAGGALNFDDGTDMVHPRGKVTGNGRTWNEAKPSDAGDLGAPGAGLSERNGPSDPDAKRNR